MKMKMKMTTIASAFLLFLLLSQVLAKALLSSNAQADVTRMDDENHVVALRSKYHYHHPKINCGYACAKRCRESSRKNMCHRACRTCCKRCHCVPPGTYGNKQACPCYARLRTHGNRPKCP